MATTTTTMMMTKQTRSYKDPTQNHTLTYFPATRIAPPESRAYKKRSTTSTRPTQAGIIPTSHPFHGGFKQFQTLLRDLPTSGAYGFWHHFSTTEPTFNFCTIGKVATTEWRRVFCKLNADDCKVPGSCGKRGCSWRTKKEMPENAPWAVFLRDPLERLLSGEKC